MAVPLARDRPLWELHVLGGLAQDRIAVLVKIHAALACDLDVVDLGLGVFDEVRGGTQDQAVVSILPRLGSADRDTARGTMAGLSAGLHRVARVVDPRKVAAGLVGRVHDAGETARITAAVTERLVRPTPSSLLNAAVGPTRRVDMRHVDLDDIHRVRKLHGGTVNDVVLAMLAGGLRTWMAAEGEGKPPGRPLRVLVPVALNSRDPDRGIGSALGGYLVDLPIGEPDPVARLHAVRQAMSVNKLAGPHRGPGAFPVLAERVPALVPWLAAAVAGRLAAPGAVRLFNTVVTSLSLHNLVLSVAGNPLEEVYPLVPLGERHALALAVAAYRDKLHIGLHADPEAIPHLDQLGDAVTAALTELAHTPAS
jgi:WS/DGAT/MGAT family acyltransferase